MDLRVCQVSGVWFQYDPRLGVFWRFTTHAGKHKRKKPFWKVTGRTVDKDGYVSIRIGKSHITGQRLAWLAMTGKMPDEQIDHGNHNRADNRWKNLFEASHADNMRNKTRYRTNTSGAVGVTFHKKTGKWQACISVAGRWIYLGLFEKREDAMAARQAAQREYRFHENHGMPASF
jgi:hypothetical protein